MISLPLILAVSHTDQNGSRRPRVLLTRKYGGEATVVCFEVVAFTSYFDSIYAADPQRGSSSAEEIVSPNVC